MRTRHTYERSFDRRSAPLQSKQVLDSLVAIWREHDRRRSSSFAESQEYGLTKNEDAKNFLRREIYALGLTLRRSPPTWDLAKFIASKRTHQTTRIAALEGQLFHTLLMGVYEEDSLISRQERWVMARELEYAARHEVPPQYLCGFLYQSGGRNNLRQKLESDFREPAFRPTSEDHA